MGSEQLVVHELRLQPELDLSYLIEECHHNQNPQECTKLYDIWSETYDDVVVKVGYHGPELLVQVCLPHLMKVLAAKQEAKILEIGCGSGATGRLLMDAVQSHAGSDAWASVHLDGTDGSRGMLDKARNQDPQVYHALYQDILLEDKPSEVLPAETYDIVMGCGIFSQGHMSAEYIHHFITAAKVRFFTVFLLRMAKRPSNFRKLEA